MDDHLIARTAIERLRAGQGPNGSMPAREEAIQGLLVDHLQLLKANAERLEREKQSLHAQTISMGVVLRALLVRMTSANVSVILSQQELEEAQQVPLEMKANAEGALVVRLGSTEGE